MAGLFWRRLLAGATGKAMRKLLLPTWTLALALLSGCQAYVGDNSLDAVTVAWDYRINGRAIQLGQASAEGLVSLVASATGDLNADGLADRAVVLRLDSRGSGIFYHLNVFLNSAEPRPHFIGEAFLGDRIQLDFLTIYGEGMRIPNTDVAVHPADYGQLVAGFFAHGQQPLSAPPSVYLTRHWRIEAGELCLLEQY